MSEQLETRVAELLAEVSDLTETVNRLEKAVAKTLNLNTKIAKLLHLVPVTEKEEREFQIMQRKNVQQSSKVYEELEDLTNNTAETTNHTNAVQDAMYMYSEAELYSDVIGDDFLRKDGNT